MNNKDNLFSCLIKASTPPSKRKKENIKRVSAKNKPHFEDDFRSLFISIINKGNKNKNEIHQGISHFL